QFPADVLHDEQDVDIEPKADGRENQNQPVPEGQRLSAGRKVGSHKKLSLPARSDIEGRPRGRFGLVLKLQAITPVPRSPAVLPPVAHHNESERSGHRSVGDYPVRTISSSPDR